MVGQNEVLNLPLVNRDLYSLLSITGGVTNTLDASVTVIDDDLGRSAAGGPSGPSSATPDLSWTEMSARRTGVTAEGIGIGSAILGPRI